eukprot:5687352-Prymnesium_polylepis.1
MAAIRRLQTGGFAELTFAITLHVVAHVSSVLDKVTNALQSASGASAALSITGTDTPVTSSFGS